MTIHDLRVSIDPVVSPFGLAPNGSTGTTISGNTTFTLTAFPILVGGPTATATLTVPVDLQPFTPILSAACPPLFCSGNNVSVPASSGYVTVTVTGVADPTLLRFVVVQNQSAMHFSETSPGIFAYLPGPFPGQDIIRVFYTNGCGPSFAEFRATVN